MTAFSHNHSRINEIKKDLIAFKSACDKCLFDVLIQKLQLLKYDQYYLLMDALMYPGKLDMQWHADKWTIQNKKFSEVMIFTHYIESNINSKCKSDNINNASIVDALQEALVMALTQSMFGNPALVAKDWYEQCKLLLKTKDLITHCMASTSKDEMFINLQEMIALLDENKPLLRALAQVSSASPRFWQPESSFSLLDTLLIKIKDASSIDYNHSITKGHQSKR